jgi:hypothetical protein
MTPWLVIGLPLLVVACLAIWHAVHSPSFWLMAAKVVLDPIIQAALRSSEETWEDNKRRTRLGLPPRSFNRRHEDEH